VSSEATRQGLMQVVRLTSGRHERPVDELDDQRPVTAGEES